MTLLTLFPPTFGYKNRSGSVNGSNWPFLATYWTGHPYSAAVAAQEVRESRYKASIVFPLLAGLTAVSWFVLQYFGLPQELSGIPALLSFLTTMVGSISRKTEILGQSVECVVRRDYYNTPLDISLDEAANQLYRRYDQFDGYDEPSIRIELSKAIPSAEKWVKNNSKLIQKALKD